MDRHLKQEEEKRPGSVKPGQDLIVAGSIGLTGAARAARAGSQAIRERFSAGYADRLFCLDQDLLHLDIQGEADFFAKAGITDVEPAGEGGIMNCLWNLLSAYGLGCAVELRSIPIRQETVEACEVFDLNPYRLHSGGCYLMAADNGFTAVRAMKKRGIEGTVIGKAEAGIARRIFNGDIETYLDRPKPDEIEKLSGAQKNKEAPCRE